MAASAPPGLVVLDVMLPDMTGYEVCRQLRQLPAYVPILMLSARDETGDKVHGLDVGADDYLTKPFEPAELLARIRALLRRHSARAEGPVVLQVNSLEMNTASREVTINGRAVQLTAKEYELLELFMRHPGQVLTRDVIYDRVWGYDFGGESNIIEVYVRYLRQKLEEGGESRMLHTVRGAGYILREQPYGER